MSSPKSRSGERIPPPLGAAESDSFRLSEDLLERIRAARALPTMSAVAMKVVEVCGDERSSIADITRLIQLDPALAAKMLRYANSPFLLPRTPVTTIARAVTTLGLASVQTLSVSFTLVSGMENVKLGAMNHRQYWTRSLLSAVAGRTITGALGARGAEEAFVAALLQDIGILILGRAFGDQYVALTNASGDDHAKLIELEKAEYGVDHSAISAWFANEWKLPKVFSLAALGSHCFLAKQHGEDPMIFNIRQAVSLSGGVADLWLTKDSAASDRVRGDALIHLGLGPDRLKRIVQQTGEQFSEAAQAIQISDVTPDVAADINAKAQELLIGFAMRTAVERGELERNARRDALTGIFNRGHMDQVLVKLFEDSVVHGVPLTVAMVDIDCFKSINDKYGHQAGDFVIQRVAELMSLEAREDDVVGRFGGDEFLLLFPSSSVGPSRAACERLCERIASTGITLASGVALFVTVSIGVAGTGAGGIKVEQLLEMADRALYRAKRAGRNRIEVA